MRALVGLHPFPVAIDLELVLPHIPETILIDIALVVVAADAETTRNGAISQHRSDIDARAARIKVIAHLAFIFAEEAVATIIRSDFALQASVLDKLHHFHKLFVGEPQVGVVGSAS